MPLFKLRAGAHATGTGPDVKYYSVADPKANVVESADDLAALEPAKFELHEGPEPPAEATEPEEPPPPPAGDAERAAAQAFANDSLGLTAKPSPKGGPRPAAAKSGAGGPAASGAAARTKPDESKR